MNEHERASRYVDLHEERLFRLGEIEDAKSEIERMEEEMEELLWMMGPVGKDRINELLEAK